jgi:chromosome segregation ATPase
MALNLLLKGTGRRRAVDKVAELRDENRRLLTILGGADDAFALLHQELAETREKQAQAEEIVVQQQADIEDLRAERDELLAEVLALRARFSAQLAAEANANRINVPPMVRIGADQDTHPHGINVMPLWEARDAGLLGPVTDPGRIG